jgi:prepilin-type N-terminal cleavage/methylation domain-containing protein
MNQRWRQVGVTLVEMLVTLAIVALAAGVIAQAMAQLARIERQLEGSQLSGVADAVRVEWLRAAIEAALPEQAGADVRCGGTERELRCLSADVPRLPVPGLATLELRLAYDEASGQTRLEVNTPGTQRRAVLLSWPGREGRLRYLDRSGQWRDAWPPPFEGRLPPLPRAVALETGIPESRAIVMTPQVSDVPLPSRHMLEQM